MAKWIDQIMQSENRIAVPIMTHPGIEEIGKRVMMLLPMEKHIIRRLRLLPINMKQGLVLL